MSKTHFVLPSETARMARALDQVSAADRQFVAETVTFLGAEVLDTEGVDVDKEAGLLSMRIERMTEQDRNVLKGLVSRILSKTKERAS